jgi:hypothetical protein
MATYPTSPKIPFSVVKTPIWETVITKFKGLSEVRKSDYSTARYKFTFKYRNLTSAEKDIIRDFFIARNGSYESFTFVNPVDSLSHTVRFLDNTLNIEYVAYDLYNINNIALIEAVGE